jgi:hypothetical protein
MSNSDPVVAAQEGSKFKRFLKRFGRRPSGEGGEVDEERPSAEDALQHNTAGGGVGAAGVGVGGTGDGANGNAYSTNASVATNGGKKSGSMRSRKGSKNNNNSSNTLDKASTSGKSSLTGRFFQTSSNAPPMPSSSQQQQQQQQQHKTNGVKAASPLLPASLANEFGGSSAEGLANTLTVPSTSPAPQLGGVPRHEPMATGDIVAAAPLNVDSQYASNGAAVGAIPIQHADGLHTKGDKDGSSITAAGNEMHAANDLTSHGSSFGSSPGRSRLDPSSDIDSAEGGIRGRDSLDNRTVDTGKSRASTKPTTLMSTETHEQSTMAQIAQYRHGDPSSAASVISSSPTSRVTSLRGGNASEGVYGGTAIQFAPPTGLGRSISGTIVQLPGAVEEMPYANVPSLSRPHPSNNPTPAGFPSDNASVLTLASSTAAASITGGAASSRGHSHYASPSVGGGGGAARSIGGSLMGERRMSSDTYASVKALPPLSRRGSDSSSRTSKSIAASATGRSSAQAMMNAATATATSGRDIAGPGAPLDRIR